MSKKQFWKYKKWSDTEKRDAISKELAGIRGRFKKNLYYNM